VTVTPLGVDVHQPAPAPEGEVRSRLGLGDRRVILCVAQKRRYKNLERLVAALPALAEDVVAVLPGSPTPYEEELRSLAARLGVAERVILPDWVSESELASLYTWSQALVLPTLTEGFGLPVLEAMRHGLPVACSDIPVLREVADDAVLYFDPTDQASVGSAVQRVLQDAPLREKLRARGRDRVAGFTWRRTAEATLEGYARALAVHRGRS
jgi:glycosyltransferase involved in cell wall biosynthesis